MRTITTPAAALALVGLLSGANAHAIKVSFAGTLTADDQVQTFTFTLAAPDTILLRTFSYAGGTNAFGAVIPRGGFDPGAAIFDGSGALVAQQDDGLPADVTADTLTNEQFDVYLVQSLAAGTYTVAISQFDNDPVGPTFSDGFTRTGDPTFTSVFGCDAGIFCDVDATSRTGFWAADVTSAVVPVPGAFGLMGMALAGLGALRRRAGTAA